MSGMDFTRRGVTSWGSDSPARWDQGVRGVIRLGQGAALHEVQQTTDGAKRKAPIARTGASVGGNADLDAGTSEGV